jgi:hypothetical protein
MKFFKRPKLRINKYILLSVLGVLVVILALGSYFLNQQRFFGKSQAELSLDNSTLVINFNIDKSDQAAATQLSQNLGVDESWEKGIKLSIDPETVNFLNGSLPTTLYVTFGPKSVSFHNSLSPVLNSAMAGKEINFASGSGKLYAVVSSNQDYSIEMKNPSDLASSATSSGMLYLSPELSGLLDLSSKVDTIDLKVNSGNINGEIKLK